MKFRALTISAAAAGAILASSPATPQQQQPAAPPVAVPPARAKPAVNPPADPARPPVPPEIPVALLVDLGSGQTLFAREAERRFMPASVTKVMTTYAAFRLIGEGKLSLQTPVTFSREVADLWAGEGSTMFLQAGDRVTVGDLILGVTTVSGNDAAAMLGVHAAGSPEGWLALMNENAAELGLRDTHFGTPNGWPDEGRTYTSARDLVTLAEAMTTRYPQLYRAYVGHGGMRYRNIAQNNHDPVTGRVQGADGIKTGYTRQAGYTFLGSAERDGRRLALVVAGAPRSAVRNRTARDLLEWGFAAFDSRTLLAVRSVVGEARVQGGASTTVPLQTATPVLASVPRGRGAGEATLTIRYRGPVEAPVAAGQRVAMLRVTLPGQEPNDIPLLAAEGVPRANPLQRLRNGVAGLFW